jgi:hypothetical protein
MMEVIRSSETSAHRRTTRHHISDDGFFTVGYCFMRHYGRVVQWHNTYVRFSSAEATVPLTGHVPAVLGNHDVQEQFSFA